MSYLFILCAQLYEEIRKVSSPDDDLSNKRFERSSDDAKRKTREFYTKVVITNGDFYSLLLDTIKVYYIVDIDLFRDFILECLYEPLPSIKNTDSEIKQKIDEYHEEEKERLNCSIHKLFIGLECLRTFINLVRHKYLNDFLTEDKSRGIIVNFLTDLISYQKRGKFKIIKSSCVSGMDILGKIEESKKYKLDYIRQFVDSQEYADLIVQQQEYYISELDRLLDKIGEMGNQTLLDANKFEVLLKFIHYMKEYANKKIETINESTAKSGGKG